MGTTSSWKGMRLDTRATYRIRVQGAIDSSWSDRLGGMSITNEATADQQGFTILVGSLTDQAALTGVLNTLYDYQLPLLSVENLDEKYGNVS